MLSATRQGPIAWSTVRLLLTKARRVLGARWQRLRGRRLIGLRLHAQHQLLARGHVAGCRRVGTGKVVIVIMMTRPRRPTNIIPGSIASIVEAAEEVEALRVHVKIQNHHDEEVEQAEEQDGLTDALQSPAQHQPGHGRGKRPSCDGQPRERRRGEARKTRSY